MFKHNFDGLVLDKWNYTNKYGASKFKPYLDRSRGRKNPLLISIECQNYNDIKDLVETQGYDCGEKLDSISICTRYNFSLEYNKNNDNLYEHITKCCLCRENRSPFIIYLQFACIYGDNIIVDYFLKRIDLSEYQPSTIKQLVYTLINTYLFRFEEYKRYEEKSLYHTLKLLFKFISNYETLEDIKTTSKYFNYKCICYKNVVQKAIEEKLWDIQARKPLEKTLPKEIINHIMEFVY